MYQSLLPSLIQIVSMSLLSENMRFLRSQRGFSQQKVADDLVITRVRYAKYEDAKSEPPLEILKRISHYYHVSIDLLVSIDLRKIDMNGLLKLDDNRILLPITVNTQGENFIEIIPQKAKAGYLTGYSDPEFIEGLQQISLPFLKDGKFRAFPIEGDSMPPHTEGSFIIGRYLEKLDEAKNGKTYVLLTKSEGIIYKRLQKKGAKSLMLQSDNTFYSPFEIRRSEILEIWEYTCSLATKEFEPENLSPQNIQSMFLEIKHGMQKIQKNLKV